MMINKEEIIKAIWDFYNCYGNNSDVFSEEQTDEIKKFLSRLQTIIENTKSTEKQNKCKKECLDCKYCVCLHPHFFECKHSELWCLKEYTKRIKYD